MWQNKFSVIQTPSCPSGSRVKRPVHVLAPCTSGALGVWQENLYWQESMDASLHKAPKMLIFHTLGKWLQ